MIYTDSTLDMKIYVVKVNPWRAKFLKIYLEMEWVDLWQLL